MHKESIVAKKKQLAVAVIGVGGMGQAHCIAVRRQVAETKLVAVVDTSKETAEKVARQHNVPYFLSTRALLKANCCDAVIIATPHPQHLPTVRDCAKAKVHILCEKPLAETVSSADKIIRCAKQNRIKLGIMFQRRFEPLWAKFFDITRSGKLGALRRAVLLLPDFRTQAYYAANTWRATWVGEGGGVLVNQAPHVMDLFLQATGLPSAVLGRVDAKLHSIEVEDHGEAMLTFKNGATGYIYASTNEPEQGISMDITFERGRLVYRDGKLEMSTYAQPLSRHIKKSREMWGRPVVKTSEVTFRRKKTGHFQAIRNFARHILYREKLLCSGESGIASLEVANAILLSSHLGREVKLPIPRREYDALLKRLRETSTFRKKVTAGKPQTDPARIK